MVQVKWQLLLYYRLTYFGVLKRSNYNSIKLCYILIIYIVWSSHFAWPDKIVLSTLHEWISYIFSNNIINNGLATCHVLLFITQMFCSHLSVFPVIEGTLTLIPMVSQWFTTGVIEDNLFAKISCWQYKLSELVTGTRTISRYNFGSM